MLLKMYINFIVKYFKAVLLGVVIATAVFGYYATHLSIDASAETLLLEDDKDLKLTREVHGRYISPDYLVISFSPNDYLLSDKTLETIQNLKDALLSIDGVDSMITLLDVPLLESPTRPIKELISNIQTLKSKNINKDLAQKELTSSPIYSQNLVSGDFKTTAMIVNLKDDDRYTQLLNARNEFMQKAKERVLTKEEEQQYEVVKNEFKSYRDISREKTHHLIENVRATLNPYRTQGELFLGGVMMVQMI